MVHLVYILKSLADGSYYIGYSKDLESRLEKHNNAKTGYSSRKKPWILVFSEIHESKTEAIKRERFLKKQKSREFINRLIKESK